MEQPLIVASSLFTGIFVKKEVEEEVAFQAAKPTGISSFKSPGQRWQTELILISIISGSQSGHKKCNRDSRRAGPKQIELNVGGSVVRGH